MSINKLIAIYARVSTQRQEDDGTIESQLLAVREYAQQNNYKIIEEYIDNGWSGDTLERPEIDRLRLGLKDSKYEAVLAYDRDRIARRYSYQELIIDEILESGKDILFVTTPAPKNSEEKILSGVRGLFAEYERVKITERMRLGKLRKIKEGKVLGTGEVLYGYTYHKNIYNNGVVEKNGYFTINEEEIKVVKLIFDLVGNQGFTIRKVVERLFEMNIKPRKSKRGVWSNSTIRTMLRNTAYIGKARWNSTISIVPKNPFREEKYKKQKKTSKKILPQDEWLFVPIPATIDKDLFERTQEQLEKNFAMCKRNKVNNYLLSGLIFCTCGQRRCGQGVNRKQKSLYYRCNDRVMRYPLPKECLESGMNATVTDEIVWDRVSSLLMNEKLLISQLLRWQKQVNNRTVDNYKDIEALEKSICKLQEEIDRYSKAYGAGIYTLEEFSRYSIPLKEKIGKLESEISESRKNDKNDDVISISEAENAIPVMIKKIKDNIDKLSFEQKKGIIDTIISKVVGNKSNITITGFIPLNIETNINNQNKLYEYKTEYRNSRVTKCRQVDTF